MLISAMSVTAMADDDVVLDDDDEEVVLDDELDVMYGATYANGATSQPSVTTSPTSPDNPGTGTTEPGTTEPSEKCNCTIQSKAPTCIEPGYEKFVVSPGCPIHLEGYEKTLPATGIHTYVANPNTAKAATCINPGKEADQICSTTGCTATIPGKEIPATGEHTYVADENTAKAATCINPGKEADQVCSTEGCTATIPGKEIPATGEHTYVADADTAKAATCFKPGKEADQVCSTEGCTATIPGKEIPATGKHTYVADENTAKAATCIKPGKEADQVCSTEGCTAKITGKEIPPTGVHEFSKDWSSNSINHWHKCLNCDETDGFSGHTWKDGGVCSTCGYGCNHIMGEFEVTKEPTCTELGEKVKKCKNNCGMTETASIPMLPHNYVAEKAPVIVYCDKPYTYTVTARCSACSATRKYNGTNPAAGHDWGAKDENDVAKCSRCNVEAILDSNGNIVRILAEGEDVGREEEIVIKLPELEPEPDPDETKSDDKPEEKTEDKPEEKAEEKPEAKPSDDKQTSSDKPKEDKPKNTTSKPSDNPNSGVTMAILPLAVAAAIVIFKKRG